MTKFGLILAGLFPIIAFIILSLGSLLPGCNLGGSGGPASGCQLIGIDISALIGFGTTAFVLSFFAVPIGLIIAVIGAFMPRSATDE
ncbi:MAG: hypothetical protein V4857_23510 [Pseudomonadota bacterium]